MRRPASALGPRAVVGDNNGARRIANYTLRNRGEETRPETASHVRADYDCVRVDLSRHAADRRRDVSGFHPLLDVGCSDDGRETLELGLRDTNRGVPAA